MKNTLLLLSLVVAVGCGRLAVERGFEFRDAVIYLDVDPHPERPGPADHYLAVSARGDMQLELGLLEMAAVANLRTTPDTIILSIQVGVQLASLQLIVSLHVEDGTGGLSEVCVHAGLGTLTQVCWPLFVVDDPTVVSGSVDFSEGTGE